MSVASAFGVDDGGACDGVGLRREKNVKGVKEEKKQKEKKEKKEKAKKERKEKEKEKAKNPAPSGESSVKKVAQLFGY